MKEFDFSRYKSPKNDVGHVCLSGLARSIPYRYQYVERSYLELFLVQYCTV